MRSIFGCKVALVLVAATVTGVGGVAALFAGSSGLDAAVEVVAYIGVSGVEGSLSAGGGDCNIAAGGNQVVGGGLVGDLSGFVASIYNRGIKFINIPTTTLSMIDSSVGGKVAVNLNDTKNVIGSFYNPEVVIIDPNVLSTLPTRHYYNGLVEALKMGLCLDKDLYNLFKHDIDSNLEDIIKMSILAKKNVVELDPKEENLRKVLNFGHTIGHAIESSNFNDFYHGEAVACGMLYFIFDKI